MIFLGPLFGYLTWCGILNEGLKKEFVRGRTLELLARSFGSRKRDYDGLLGPVLDELRVERNNG